MDSLSYFAWQSPFEYNPASETARGPDSARSSDQARARVRLSRVKLRATRERTGRQHGMGPSAASSMARPQAAPGDFTTLLDGFREKLDRELEAWLAAKRQAAAGAREMLDLIDGVGRLVTQGGKRLRP